MGLAALLCLPVGCAKERPEDALVVGAASSAAEVLGTIADAWSEVSGQPVKISSASSSTLARQIERGSPVDILVSADRAWVEYLTEAGLARSASMQVLAGNQLVLYARAGDGTGDAEEKGAAMFRGFPPLSLGDELPRTLAGKRWATGDPEHVPLGRYAKQALASLGWWEALAPTLIPAAEARAALRLVELGQADFGVGYATDVAGPRWAVRPLGDGLHGAIEITAVQIDGAREGAAEFMAFLRGPVAQGQLRAAGFRAPGPFSEGEEAR